MTTKFYINSFTTGKTIRQPTDGEIRINQDAAMREHLTSGLALGNCLGVWTDQVTGQRVYVSTLCVK